MRQMPRPRFLAIVLLPLLATLLAAQAPPLPPKKPAAVAAPKITTPVAQPKKPEAKKPEPKKTEAKKPEAKKPAPKKTEAKKSAPNKNALEDYHSLWDVTAETTRADIVKRFGEPQRVGDGARKPYYYFNDTLEFFFTSEDTVATMIVGNSFAPIPPNTIPPEVIKKAFIGRTRDDLLKMFGPADVVSSENYSYRPKSGAFYKVEFQCYDINGYVCEQVLVQF